MVNTVAAGAPVVDTEMFKLTPVVNTKDVKHAPRSYKFSFVKIDDADAIVDNAIYQNEVFTVIPTVANEAALDLDNKTYEVGQTFFLQDTKEVKSITFDGKLQNAVSAHQKIQNIS